jgi:hypothetical protein
MNYISQTTANPPLYDAFNQDGGEHCGEWAVDALLAAANSSALPMLPFTADPLLKLLTALIWSPYAEAPLTYSVKEINNINQFASTFHKFLGFLLSQNNSWWGSEFAGGKYQPSPIILNLSGNPLLTTPENAGTYFDLQNTGFAVKTGWVAPNDGLLVWDRNGNGTIDNGSELFGNYTPMANGVTAANGFAALASYDANHDGVINASDPIWNSLNIWVDSNGNGVTDPGELRTLASLGITSLNLSYTDQGTTVKDASGNNPEFVGSFTMNGVTTSMVDVNFAADSSRTVAATYVATTAAIDALPDLQEQGTLYSLHQAMARDTTGALQSLVRQFTTATTVAARNALMEQILIDWAGAQNVDPTSRNLNSGNFNAQHLAILEAAMGRAFNEEGSNPTNPSPEAAVQLTVGYTVLFERIYAELAAQTFLAPFYNEITTVTDSTGTHFDFTVVLADLFGTSRTAAVQQVDVQEFYRTIFASGVLDSQVNYARLLSALAANAPQYVTAVNQIVAPYYVYDMTSPVGPTGANQYVMQPVVDNSTVIGGLGGSKIYANVDLARSGFFSYETDIYNTTVYGNAGTNQIFAKPDGVDHIYGGTGDDLIGDYGVLAAGTILDGGAGNNILAIFGTNDDGFFSNYTDHADFTQATIANFQTLSFYNSNITLTAAQLGVFSYITTNGLRCEIDASTAGTYSLRGISITDTGGIFSMSSLNTAADVTLIGNDVNGQVLTGGSGITTLFSGNGAADQLIGGSGVTTLTAGSGAGDILTAGTGATTLNAGTGSGDVLYVLNGGNDIINAYASDIITVGGNGQFGNTDKVTVSGGNVTLLNVSRADIYGGSNTITVGVFDSVSLQNGNGNTVTMGSNSVLYVNSGTTDVINGGGSEQYNFAAAFGQDTINNGTSTAANGTIAFSAGVTDENLWFVKSGNDLLIDLLGTTGQIKVAGWFSGTLGNEVQSITTTDGLNLTPATVTQLVNAMAVYQSARASFNPATATAMPVDTTLQTAIADSWHGIITATAVTVATAIANQTTLDATPGGYAVADTAANVVAGMTFLTSDASYIALITLTDSATPTLALTVAQYSADAAALRKITSAYNLSISGVAAASAAAVSSYGHVTSITVSDTAANVLTNIAALETLATGAKLASITLTDSTTPTLALTSAQDAADLAVLGKIVSAYNLTVSSVLAANAASVAGQAHFVSETISDTAADFVTSLTSLETLAAANKITSIVFTDSTTPTITLTAAQQTADAAALAKITSPYNLVITGGTVTAAVAATATSAVAVSDTSANVLTYLSQLQTQAAAGRITSIALTDSTTPTLPLTAAQLTADATVLSKISSAYNLSISGVTAANAATVAGQAHVTSITVSDTAANVLANIAALQTLAIGTKLSSIALTDGATPTLALTAAQFTADTVALGKIGSAYNLSISGVTAANASSVAGAAHVTSIVVSDTAANVLANIAALETLAIGTKLASITLTDSTTPTLALTSAQDAADSAVLGKITSAYNLTVFGVTAANAATIAAQAHFASETVSDTAANFVTNLSSLETLAAANKVTSIAFTDSTKPTITLTAAQQTADAAALAKITSPYTLVITGGTVTAAVAATATSAVAVSDTAANVLTYLAQLQTQAAAGRITSIAFTDNTTPTLSLTEAQLTADATVLGKITSVYNLSVTGGGTKVLPTGISAKTITLQSAATAYNFTTNSTPSVTIVDNGANGNDAITAIAGDTVNVGGNGQYGNTDSITLSGGNVTLQNTSRADVYGGSNTITVGQSDLIGIQNGNNNTLTVGTGSAVYVNSGTGDVINATAGGVTVYASSAVTMSLVGGNNSVNAANGDTIAVSGNGQFGNDNYITVTGGIVNVAANARADVYGGSDVVTAGANTLIGIQNGNGNTVALGTNSAVYVNSGTSDVINGGGNEQYNFAAAFGQDTINNGTNPSANGTIAFGSGITDEKLWFMKSGNDLLIDQIGTNGQIKVAGWYSAAGDQVQSFNANGLTLDTQLAQLVQAMASYGAAHTGFNPATATAMPTDTTLQGAITAAWHA